jgi:hypothetical protein
MTIINKSFFSRKVDFLAFGSFIPVYITYYFVFEILKLPLPPNPNFSVLLLGYLLVEGSHLYSTYLVSYGDKEISRQLKPLFYGIPLALVVSAFTLQFIGKQQYLYYFMAYLAVVHFIRQDFGWMKIATSFDSHAPRWLNMLDVWSSYGMTVLPMLYITRKEAVNNFWYQKGDLFYTPDVIAHTAHHLYWPVVAIFIAGNAYHAYQTRRLNLSKYLVATNTFFGWYMSKIYVENGYLAIWLMIFHHGVPYYFIVFKTERISKDILWLQRLGRFKYLALYLCCVMVFFTVFWSLGMNSYVVSLKSSVPSLKSLIYAIAISPQMTHSILDGYIWKKKYGLVGGLNKRAGNTGEDSSQAA